MEKVRRIMAMAGVCLLVFLYLMTLITAILATPESHDWFIASVGATILVPIIIYVYSMLIRITKESAEKGRQREAMFMKQMEQQLNDEKKEAQEEEQKAE